MVKLTAKALGRGIEWFIQRNKEKIQSDEFPLKDKRTNDLAYGEILKLEQKCASPYKKQDYTILGYYHHSWV